MMNGYEYTGMDAILAGSFRAAIYCRLSKDDDLDGESASIANQRDMLELSLIHIFCYNGYKTLDDGKKGGKPMHISYQPLWNTLDVYKRQRHQCTPETGIKECNKCVREYACRTQTDAATHHTGHHLSLIHI